jgi:hypothetical protein
MISANVRSNPPNLAQVISDLPRHLRGPATEEASKYLVGNGSHGLSHYPPYRYNSRASAYGFTFSSDRQRRKVMAMIRNGEILPGYPRRTGNTQRSWAIIYDGVKTRIINPTAGALYTVGDPGQARLNELGGWRRLGLIIASNENGMIRAAEQRVQREINDRGL